MDHKLEKAISCKKSSFRLYTNFYFLFRLLINSGKIEYNYKLVYVMEAKAFSFPGRISPWSPGHLPHSMLHKSLSEYRSRVSLFQTASRHGHKRSALEGVTDAQKHGTKPRTMWFDGLSNSPSSSFCSFLVSFLSVTVFSYFFFSLASQTELIIYSNMSDFYRNIFHFMWMLSSFSLCIWQW